MEKVTIVGIDLAKNVFQLREVVNGLMDVLSTGCRWRVIPKDLPARSTVFDYFDLWNWDGTLRRIHQVLYEQCREAGVTCGWSNSLHHDCIMA